MDHEPRRCRLVGNYILGPKIGSGSFAVVWRSRHRSRGVEVAVKEIEKKQLSSKVYNSLLKEIAILRDINHPNIVRLHEAIETEDKLYLVLEYCMGGDLGAYIQRFGRVSEAVAKHFMGQLASGLQVLRENNLIHRDLKPQNLLLSSPNEKPVLKIGDFGFARYLTPQGLADTLCGSPLYMAPEIIQNKKYDAKADLWSVGVILFQLVAGRPPFHGSNEFQLFQNILNSNDLKFPQGITEKLHPDCIDLCRSLLRRNPVERLTYEEFFNHKFIVASRSQASLMVSSSAPGQKPLLEQGEILANVDIGFSTERAIDLDASNALSANISGRRMEGETSNISKPKGVDPVDSIEREYVLVNVHSAFMDTLSSLEASSCSVKETGESSTALAQNADATVSSAHPVQNLQRQGSSLMVRSQASAETTVQGHLSCHPSVRLRRLNHYVKALSELAQEKLNAGQRLDSFSVELVILAIWKEALQVSRSWAPCSASGYDPKSSPASYSPANQENTLSSVNFIGEVDFNCPTAVQKWAEQGFLEAFDQAERMSNYLHEMDATVEMPDAIDIIFKAALAAGTSGAVDELIDNRRHAAALYAKASVLLSFILGEATSLPLNPLFSLTEADRQRIQTYIVNLKAHQNLSEMSSMRQANSGPF